MKEGKAGLNVAFPAPSGPGWEERQDLKPGLVESSSFHSSLGTSLVDGQEENMTQS